MGRSGFQVCLRRCYNMMPFRNVREVFAAEELKTVAHRVIVDISLSVVQLSMACH